MVRALKSLMLLFMLMSEQHENVRQKRAQGYLKDQKSLKVIIKSWTLKGRLLMSIPMRIQPIFLQTISQTGS